MSVQPPTSGHDAPAPEPSPAWQLMRLLDGFVTTQLLYVAAKLGVAGVLADGPRSGAEVAQAVGVDPRTMTRVLRGLAIEDVVAETDDGRFALTPVGACLDALGGAAIVRGEVYYRSAGGLLDAVLDGGTAFERVYGERFFDHLDGHREHGAAFQASMAGRAEQEASDVVAAYDFGGVQRLVDVGGGRGVLLAAILQAVPELRGVLFDREAAVPAARTHLDAAGVGDRAVCAAGDFFVEVPADADAYVLSRVLHDWDDDDAGRILARCRAAMRPDSTAARGRGHPPRAGPRPSRGDPDGPPHAAAARGQRADGRRVPRAARSCRFRGAASRADAVAGRVGRHRSHAGVSRGPLSFARAFSDARSPPAATGHPPRRCRRSRC